MLNFTGRRRRPIWWMSRRVGLVLLASGLVSVCRPVTAPPPPARPAADDAAPRAATEATVPASPTIRGATPAVGEVRGLWVVRTTLRHADSIRVMVERADRAGFNTLLVQVRGRGDAYYRSELEPRAEGLVGPRGFDPLALVIREAHARGLKVHAWVNTYLVGGLGALPASPDHIIRARPDLLGVPRALALELYSLDPTDPSYVPALQDYARRNRERVEGIFAAPAHPEVKERLARVWMELIEGYDLDGLHFDYLRYPGLQFDYSRESLLSFRSWVLRRLSPRRRQELEALHADDPLAYVDALPGPWEEFRREQVTGLLSRVYYAAKAAKPDIVISAAVFPDADAAATDRLQDWAAWMDAGILDAVAPMAYTPDDETFQALIRGAVERVGRRRVWAGIGVYQTTFEGTLEKIARARSEGAQGILLFSYDWAVSAGVGPDGEPFLDRVGRLAFQVVR